MKRYVIITNIWGKKPKGRRRFTWDIKESGYYPDFFESEKQEFDTKEELDEFINVFKEYCSTFKLPECIKDIISEKYPGYKRWGGPDERLYGYVYGDRETMKLVWGGYKLKDYNPGTDKRVMYDLLFRGPNEIPEKYMWDDGEYEGWLQYRWGDGKNAVGYVEEKKPKKKQKKEEHIVEESDEKEYIESDFDVSFGQEIEDAFLRKEEKEKIKLLEEKSCF